MEEPLWFLHFWLRDSNCQRNSLLWIRERLNWYGKLQCAKQGTPQSLLNHLAEQGYHGKLAPLLYFSTLLPSLSLYAALRPNFPWSLTTRSLTCSSTLPKCTQAFSPCFSIMRSSQWVLRADMKGTDTFQKDAGSLFDICCFFHLNKLNMFTSLSSQTVIEFQIWKIKTQ